VAYFLGHPVFPIHTWRRLICDCAFHHLYLQCI